MSHKADLRKQREGTVINTTSQRQESNLMQAVYEVEVRLKQEFPHIQLSLKSEWFLIDVVSHLKKMYPLIDFATCSDRASMRPDGGILSIMGQDGQAYPFLFQRRRIKVRMN